MAVIFRAKLKRMFGYLLLVGLGLTLYRAATENGFYSRTRINKEVTKTFRPLLVFRKENTLFEQNDFDRRQEYIGLPKTILWINKPIWINLETGNTSLKTDCPELGCIIKTDHKAARAASAIVFTLSFPYSGNPPFPVTEKDPNQPWIYFLLEPPPLTLPRWWRGEQWRNSMNWSMSYRVDSDVHFPYGKMELRDKPLGRDYSAIYRRKTKHVAWAVSHCKVQSKRDLYVQKMNETDLQVDIYGRCGKSRVNREKLHKMIDDDYLFYLSFENSLCKDYITEKFFEYYQYDVVVVIRGGADVGRLLPEDTFIDAGKFPNATSLAKYLLKVANSEELYTRYLRNIDKYRSVRNHGQLSYCTICEKLHNFDENRKWYNDLVTHIFQNQCSEVLDIG